MAEEALIFESTDIDANDFEEEISLFDDDEVGTDDEFSAENEDENEDDIEDDNEDENEAGA